MTGGGGGADFAAVRARSEGVAWALDDVLTEGARFDLSRPLLPASMTGLRGGPALTDRDQLLLGHIRAHGYLATFGVVEEMILPFVLARIEERLAADLDELRALLQFADEEAKHIALFRRFEATFCRQFEHRCGVIGPGPAVAEHVLAHTTLGVALFVLHIEWMTQRHYVALANGDEAVEPAFGRLLKMHWIEERQHARLDGMLVAALTASASKAERAQAVIDYVALLAWLSDALWTQADFDRDALERSRGAALPDVLKRELRVAQHRSLHEVFVMSGATHPRVVEALRRVHPSGGDVAAQVKVRAA